MLVANMGSIKYSHLSRKEGGQHVKLSEIVNKYCIGKKKGKYHRKLTLTSEQSSRSCGGSLLPSSTFTGFMGKGPEGFFAGEDLKASKQL